MQLITAQLEAVTRSVAIAYVNTCPYPAEKRATVVHLPTEALLRKYSRLVSFLCVRICMYNGLNFCYGVSKLCISKKISEKIWFSTIAEQTDVKLCVLNFFLFVLDKPTICPELRVPRLELSLKARIFRSCGHALPRARPHPLPLPFV